MGDFSKARSNSFLRARSSSLWKVGSRLLSFRGIPVEVMIQLLKEMVIKLTDESHQANESITKERRFLQRVPDFWSSMHRLAGFNRTMLHHLGLRFFSPMSHTLFNPEDIIQKNAGRAPFSYQSFLKLAGNPPLPLATTISSLPPVRLAENYEILRVPSIKELGSGYISQEEFSPFKGGESKALKRLRESLNNKVSACLLFVPKESLQ